MMPGFHRTIRKLVSLASELPVDIMALSAVWLLLSSTAPSIALTPSGAAGVYAIVVTISWIVMLAWIIASVLAGRQASSTAIGFVRLLLCFGVAQLAVRHFAEPIATAVDTAVRDPSAMATVLIAVAIAYAAFVLAQPRRGEWRRALPPVPQRTLTRSERHQCAVHEAGHALVYALVSGRLPEALEARVFERTRDGSRGYVGTCVEMAHDSTEVGLRWLMLRSLAGLAAERVVLGYGSTGSDGDLRQWVRVARGYLQCGFGGAWIAEPTDESDAAINRQQLDALKAAQLDALSGFLAHNREALTALTDRLLATGRIHGRELEVLIQRAEPTEALPRLPIRFDGGIEAGEITLVTVAVA